MFLSTGDFHQTPHGRQTPNYVNYRGGFGGVRHGFNSPNIFPPVSTHLPLSYAHSQPHRVASPRMIEIQDDEQRVFTEAPTYYASTPHEVDMDDNYSTAETIDCPMIDQSADSTSRKTSGPRAGLYGPQQPLITLMNPQANEPLHNTQSEGITYRPPPTIHSLLNPVPKCQSPHGSLDRQSQYQGGGSGRSRTPPSTPRTSQFSDTSFSTISQFSLATKRYHLIVDLYNICLQASSTYIDAIKPHNRRHQRRTPRFTPYRNRLPRTRATGNKDPTLMDNISTIATHLWRKARRNIMAPHRAEADAVRRMRDLYAWGEVIVNAMESGIIHDDDEESDGSSMITGLNLEGIRVAHAAKAFCRWLRDMAACGECKNVLNRLRELDEEEEERSSSIGDSLDVIL